MTHDEMAGQGKEPRPASDEPAHWAALRRAQHGPFEGRLVECYNCGGVYPRADMQSVDEIPGYRWARYCPTCAQEIRAAHTRRCVLCGAIYVARTPGELDGLCADCSDEDHAHELVRIRHHLARASALGLPATLTLRQWMATVEHFGRRCAYCRQRPFTDLDHFVPLAAGGGTTAANCVPACTRCNSLKRAADPSEAKISSIPAGDIARVARFLRKLG